MTLAWPGAHLGAMGLEGAVRLSMRRELEAIADDEEREAQVRELTAYAQAHSTALNVARHFEIDDVDRPGRDPPGGRPAARRRRPRRTAAGQRPHGRHLVAARRSAPTFSRGDPTARPRRPRRPVPPRRATPSAARRTRRRCPTPRPRSRPVATSGARSTTASSSRGSSAHTYASWWHGEQVATCGIAGVTVAPEHRGEGLLLPLFEAALGAAAERGEVLSTLYPTATGIYRSLGYELVSSLDTVEVDLRRARRASARRPRPARGAPTVADVPAVRAVYDRWAAAQNGPLTRTGPRFATTDEELLDGQTADHPRRRRRRPGRRLRQLGPRRRATTRRRRSCEVHDLLATTADGYRALWRMLGTLTSVAGRVRLSHLGRRPRPPGAAHRRPGTWSTRHPYMLRVSDPAAALTGARLALPGLARPRSTFAVAGDRLGPADGTLPARRSASGPATCERVGRPRPATCRRSPPRASPWPTPARSRAPTCACSTTSPAPTPTTGCSTRSWAAVRRTCATTSDAVLLPTAAGARAGGGSCCSIESVTPSSGTRPTRRRPRLLVADEPHPRAGRAARRAADIRRTSSS